MTDPADARRTPGQSRLAESRVATRLPAQDLDRARAFIRAWAAGDFDAAARYLDGDVVFDTAAQVTGKAAFLAALQEFAAAITRVDLLARPRRSSARRRCSTRWSPGRSGRCARASGW